MKKLFTFLATFFVFCFTAFGIAAMLCIKHTVTAAEKPYNVGAGDFEVSAVSATSSIYKLTLRYVGENPDGLPQSGSTVYGITDAYVQTDDADILYLKRVQPVNATTDSLTLQFSVATSGDKLGFKDAAPTKLVIPAGTVFTPSSDYTNNGGTYSSLTFTSDLTLERPTNDYDDANWICVDTQALEQYEISLAEKSVFLGAYRDGENFVCIKLALPYTATQAPFYEGALTLIISGAEYTPSLRITQETGDNILLLVLENSEALIGNMGDITVTLNGGELVCETLGVKLTVTGEKTLYGYADGGFYEDKRIEIRVTDGEQSSVTTVDAEKDTYQAPAAKGITGKMFFGWRVGKTIYREGQTLELAAYTQTGVTFTAEYIACGLVNGAWIRSDGTLGQSGIRFACTITGEDFEKYQSYVCGVGVIVMPTDMIEDGKDFTLQNYLEDNKARDYYAAKNRINCSGGSFTLYATVSTILPSNYNREYSARAYMIVNYGEGDEYVWGSDIVRRTPYGLATTALVKASSEISEAHKAVLQTYVNDVANITFDGVTASVVSVTETQGIDGITVSKSGSTVTVILQTQTERFVGVTYNGKRIKGSEQSYANGKLTITFEETTA